jgi:hypothetical protein
MLPCDSRAAENQGARQGARVRAEQGMQPGGADCQESAVRKAACPISAPFPDNSAKALLCGRSASPGGSELHLVQVAACVCINSLLILDFTIYQNAWCASRVAAFTSCCAVMSAGQCRSCYCKLVTLCLLLPLPLLCCATQTYHVHMHNRVIFCRSLTLCWLLPLLRCTVECACALQNPLLQTINTMLAAALSSSILQRVLHCRQCAAAA